MKIANNKKSTAKSFGEKQFYKLNTIFLEIFELNRTFLFGPLIRPLGPSLLVSPLDVVQYRIVYRLACRYAEALSIYIRFTNRNVTCEKLNIL